MIAPLITFLSSSAGGALIGWIQSHLEQKRADKLASKERKHKRDLAANETALNLYDKSIEAAHLKPIPYTYSKTITRPMFLLVGPPVTYSKSVTRTKVSRTPREKTIASIILMVMATYCVICLWVGFWFMADVSIIPPDSKQAGIDLLLFKVKFGGNKPVDQAVLGPLLYMLSPLIFISSNWIIRKNPNK